MTRKALISEDTDFFNPEMAERTLLAAVIERAYRDLYSNNHNDFRSAIKWILPEKELYIDADISEGISFSHCIEILELTVKQVMHIKNAAMGFLDYVTDIQKFKLERPEVIKIRQYSHDRKRDFVRTKRQKWRRGHVVRV